MNIKFEERKTGTGSASEKSLAAFYSNPAAIPGQYNPRFIPVLRWFMEFFNSAIEVLQTLVIALGAALGVWGAINLLEGYGNDNPGARSQGIKQLVAGGGIALVGMTLVPLLSGLFG